MFRKQVAYGGQDDTQPTSGGFHKRLNLFPDASIHRSRDHNVDVLPLEVDFIDSIGMPAPENWYVTYHLNPSAGCTQAVMPSLSSPQTVLIPSVVYVEVEDLGTGNRYNDSAFEVTLMHESFEQCADNKGLFAHGERFHVGFHARDTRPANFHIRVKVWPILEEQLMPTRWYSQSESLHHVIPAGPFEIKQGSSLPLDVNLEDTRFGWKEEQI